MALSWSGRRQLLYTTVGVIAAIVLVVAGWKAFFTSPPTCSDHKQNQGEAGVDCGNPCSVVCADAAHEPTVVWSRAFATSPTTYSAAAYIKNTNIDSAARNVRYSFQLFDENNILVIAHDGVMQIPPVGTVPILESNINVGSRTVARTFFAFADENLNWFKVPKSAIPVIAISQQNLNQDGTRLSATLTNESNNDAKNITAIAVLFDSDNVARAASKSLIATIAAKSSQEVVFTWPQSIPNIVRAEITPLPSF